MIGKKNNKFCDTNRTKKSSKEIFYLFNKKKSRIYYNKIEEYLNASQKKLQAWREENQK